MLPTWDDILGDLDYNLHNGGHVKQLDNGGFVTHEGFRMEKVRELGDRIQAIRPSDLLTAHIYISLSSQSSTFGRHQDVSHDVYYVQALGKAEWMDEDDGEHTYTLEPGDMIYVAAGLFHTPRPLTPRAGLSFGFEY